MKNLKLIFVAAFLAVVTVESLAQGKLKEDPAYLDIDGAIDFSVVKPEVNVNLPKFMLMDVVSEFDGGEGDPFAKLGLNIRDVVKDVKLIRVAVIEASEKDRKALTAGAEKLRKHLEAEWLPVVSVPEEKVGIYVMSDASGEKMAGLALLVDEGDSVVIGNVVGGLPLGKLLKMAVSLGAGGDFDLEEVLEQIAGAGLGEAVGAEADKN